MDSNSDSDGSHISATPPRDPIPSSEPPPSPPAFISSTNCRIRARATSSPHAKPKKKKSTRKSSPSDPNPTRTEPALAVEDAFPSLSATLPFQIHSRSSDQNRPVSAIDGSLETLPAGFFSTSASFSKVRRSSLNFDRIEDDQCPSSAPILRPKVDEISVPDCSAYDWLSEELKDEAAVGYGRSSAKFTKKHSNLIGSNVPLPPVKLRKCSGEGNLVRLNLKRNKRKFLNKRGSSSYSGVRRSCKRYKKKKRSENEAKTEEGVCEEDDLVVETMTEENQRRVVGVNNGRIDGFWTGVMRFFWMTVW